MKHFSCTVRAGKDLREVRECPPRRLNSQSDSDRVLRKVAAE